jgi:hydroxymethylglutaryl-CoA lyase
VSASDSVRIFEVGPRDGLQNEKRVISFEDRLFLIEGLASAGLRDIEVGAFVREDRVPQMAKSDEVLRAIAEGRVAFGNARAWNLVPNARGMQNAVAAGAKQVAVFTAATEGFNQKNIGMTIDQSLAEIAQVMEIAKAHGISVRGYVSTAFGCPYEGRVPADQPLKVISKLISLGVEEVSVGDTIGVATPRGVEEVIRPAISEHGVSKVAVHFHDTRGTALANTLRSLEIGVRTVDSSAGGLGGCPFAPGATGNLATEDLVYMLDGMAMPTGVDLMALCRTSLEFARRIQRPLTSRYLAAFAATRP